MSRTIIFVKGLAGGVGFNRGLKIPPIEELDDFPFIAGEVKDFNVKDIIKQRKAGWTKEDLKRTKYMDPFIEFANAAALEAIADSGVDLESGEIDPNRVGVIMGSGQGGLQTIEREYKRLLEGKKVSPFLIPREIPNLAAGNISQAHRSTVGVESQVQHGGHCIATLGGQAHGFSLRFVRTTVCNT